MEEATPFIDPPGAAPDFEAPKATCGECGIVEEVIAPATPLMAPVSKKAPTSKQSLTGKAIDAKKKSIPPTKFVIGSSTEPTTSSSDLQLLCLSWKRRGGGFVFGATDITFVLGSLGAAD